MVGYRQTNQKTDTGKTLTRWPVFVDHFNNEAGLPKKKDEILGLKPGVYGFSIDLKALYRRIFKKRK